MPEQTQLSTDMPTLDEIERLIDEYDPARFYVWVDEHGSEPRLVNRDTFFEEARDTLVDITDVGGPPEAVNGTVTVVVHTRPIGNALILEI